MLYLLLCTDQLDGETNWKLHAAVPECQKLDEGDLVGLDAKMYGELVSILICVPNSRLGQLISQPIKDIQVHAFVGTFMLNK